MDELDTNFMRVVDESLPEIPFEIKLRCIKSGSGEFKKVMKQLFFLLDKMNFTSGMLERQKIFCREYFQKLLPSDIAIPEKRSEDILTFDNLSFMPEGLKFGVILEGYKKEGIKINLDEGVLPSLEKITSERVGNYAFWSRKMKLPTLEEHARMFEDLKRAGKKMMTLEERLSFGLNFFLETGEHLDTDGFITFCGGSIFREPSDEPQVPVVCCNVKNTLRGVIAEINVSLIPASWVINMDSKWRIREVIVK